MSHHHYKPAGPMKPCDYFILVIVFIILGAALSFALWHSGDAPQKTHHRSR